jgi:DNA-binding transcriptional regulator PaaX
MTVRDLVVDLFTEHLGHVTDEPVRLRSLVALLEQLSVAEPTTRMTTAALRRAGWLTASRDGRETRYAPTERLHTAVRADARRVEQQLRPWDGRWRMVIYTVPETDRAARERVRRTLTRHGFGPLAPATWLSPHPTALDVVRTALAGEPLTRLDLLTAQVPLEAGGSDSDLAARCWDLPAVAAVHCRLLERWRAGAAVPAPHGPRALVTHLRELAHLRAMRVGDPVLPDGLWPPGWPGAQLCAAWEELCARLVPPARAFVAEVLARPVGAQRCTVDMSG